MCKGRTRTLEKIRTSENHVQRNHVETQYTIINKKHNFGLIQLQEILLV